jgi:hypothetical protein
LKGQNFTRRIKIDRATCAAAGTGSTNTNGRRTSTVRAAGRRCRNVEGTIAAAAANRLHQNAGRVWAARLDAAY